MKNKYLTIFSSLKEKKNEVNTLIRIAKVHLLNTKLFFFEIRDDLIIIETKFKYLFTRKCLTLSLIKARASIIPAKKG
jgi:hypothetical protein